MVIPLFDNNIFIHSHNSANTLKVIGFNPLNFTLDYLISNYIKNRFPSITLNVNMHRLMFAAKEEKGETKKTKYFRHNIKI